MKILLRMQITTMNVFSFATNNPDTMEYICNYVRTSERWIRYLDYLYNQVLNYQNTGFRIMCVKCNPSEEIIFKNKVLNPTDWSFCFIKLLNQPNSLFMFFTDHEAGVNKRLCKKNMYTVTSDTICVYGENTVEPDDYLHCGVGDCEGIPYAKLNWFTVDVYDYGEKNSIKHLVPLLINLVIEPKSQKLFVI